MKKAHVLRAQRRRVQRQIVSKLNVVGIQPMYGQHSGATYARCGEYTAYDTYFPSSSGEAKEF
jgi:hypothetical protein